MFGGNQLNEENLLVLRYPISKYEEEKMRENE